MPLPVRCTAALWVSALVVALLALPTSAQAGTVAVQDPGVAVTASAHRVAPRTTVVLEATADAPVTKATWSARRPGSHWRKVRSWAADGREVREVTTHVRSRRHPGTKVFRLRVTFADGSAAADRVRVRTVAQTTVATTPVPPTPVDAGEFKAVTWNVYFGTPVETLRPILRRLRDDGVSLFLMQEMSNPAARRMLEEEGLTVHYVGYQWVVAWDPTVWRALDLASQRLSATSFTRLDGTGPIFADSATGLLEHRSGRTVQVMSYHLPPNVQTRSPEPNRLAIDRDAAATWRRLVDASTADAVLFAGDDNIDEEHGYRTDGTFWDFMRAPATGLFQLQAPTGTTGPRRRIDDFRISGLTPGEGYTADGGGDHKLFVSAFSWG